MRGRYMFDFAYLFKMGPPQVDVLRYGDFVNLILNIEDYKREMKKREVPQ